MNEFHINSTLKFSENNINQSRKTIQSQLLKSLSVFLIVSVNSFHIFKHYFTLKKFIKPIYLRTLKIVHTIINYLD